MSVEKFRQCSKCKRLLPANADNFHVTSRKYNGITNYYLRGECKQCRQLKKTTQLDKSAYIRATKFVYKVLKDEGLTV